jgi:hypothetical protein
MKLTTKRLLRGGGTDLVALGYRKFEDGFFGSDGLFVKKLPNGFLLTLGLIISRHFESKFTGAYYLSKNTRWSSVWGDIPPESYKRIGFFIKNEERETLVDESDRDEKVKDFWWDASDVDSLSRFLAAVKLTEPRFIGQHGLIENVEKSVEGNRLIEQASMVHSIIKTGIDAQYDFKYIPVEPIKDIPIEWFKAAELTIVKNSSVLNDNKFKLLAADDLLISKMK